MPTVIDSRDPLKGFAPSKQPEPQIEPEPKLEPEPEPTKIIDVVNDEVNRVLAHSINSFSAYSSVSYETVLPNEKEIYDELLAILQKKFPAVINGLFQQKKIDSLGDLLMATEVYYLMESSDLVAFLNEFLEGDSNYKFVEMHEFVSEVSCKFDKTPVNPNVTYGSCGFHLVGYDAEQMILSLATNPFTPYKSNVTMAYQLDDVRLFYLLPYEELEILASRRAPISLETQPRFTSCNIVASVWMKRILYDALECHATDIHMENYMIPEIDPRVGTNSFSRRYTVSFRILTDLVEQPRWEVPKQFNDSFMREIVKCTANFEVELDYSGGVKTTWLNVLQDGLVNLRLAFSSISGNGDYTCVIRVQQLNIIPKTIDSLGFNGLVTTALCDIAERSTGLTLLAGPRGSGKNTTLNALVAYKRRKHPGLSFIEYSSPIEFIQPFPQVDYGDSRERLQNYISLSKKQDVNVALLNEIPDAGVAPAVADLINSSISVMTTLHINRLWDLPSKMREYFGEHFAELYTHITGVVLQRMFVPLCPHCREETFLTDSPVQGISLFALDLMKKFKIAKFYHAPKGVNHCKYCGGSGLDNRVQPLAEFLIFNEQLRTDLLQCDTVWQMSDVIKSAVRKNKNALEDSIAEAVSTGLLSPSAFDFLK